MTATHPPNHYNSDTVCATMEKSMLSAFLKKNFQLPHHQVQRCARLMHVALKFQVIIIIVVVAVVHRGVADSISRWRDELVGGSLNRPPAMPRGGLKVTPIWWQPAKHQQIAHCCNTDRQTGRQTLVMERNWGGFPYTCNSRSWTQSKCQ